MTVLDMNTSYGRRVAREFFSGKYDNMTVGEFRSLMRENDMGIMRPDPPLKRIIREDIQIGYSNWMEIFLLEHGQGKN
jgi:hypothetical protein